MGRFIWTFDPGFGIVNSVICAISSIGFCTYDQVRLSRPLRCEDMASINLPKNAFLNVQRLISLSLAPCRQGLYPIEGGLVALDPDCPTHFRGERGLSKRIVTALRAFSAISLASYPHLNVDAYLHVIL